MIRRPWDIGRIDRDDAGISCDEVLRDGPAIDGQGQIIDLQSLGLAAKCDFHRNFEQA